MVLFLEAAPPKSASQDWCLSCHYWATYGLLKWCPKSINIGQEYAGLDSPARRDGTCAYNYFRWGWHPASVSHSCSLMLGCHARCPIIPVLQRLITPSFHTTYWHNRLQYSSLCRQLLEGDVTWTLYPSTLAVSVWDIQDIPGQCVCI